MTGIQRWLRRLDEDALGGRLWSRRVVVAPLAAALGLLLGGSAGYVVGLGVGAVAVGSDHAAIAFPVVGAVIGLGLGSAGGLTLGLRLRLPHRPRSADGQEPDTTA